METKKIKINIIDIVILVVVVAVAAGAYFFMNKDAGTVETKTMQYVIELSDNPEGFAENIEIGDELTDNIKNYYMGKIVDVEVVPFKDLIEDKENGVWKESEVEGRETAIITLEAPIVESGSSITVNGYYIVRGGLEVAAKGPGYAGRGHILKVIR